MPGKLLKSGGDEGDAGEGEGTSQDAEWAAEELGDPLPGLLPPHLNAGQCVLGMRNVDAVHRRNGEPLFEVEYKD